MYQPIIGLEIHAELKTKTKMFCSCKNDPDERHPNVNICPVCMGHPGTLPTINKEAVIKTIKTGLALNCQVPERSKFDRKNYFYPDLPKGYQISQYDMPLCKNGYLDIPAEYDIAEVVKPETQIKNLKIKRIRIRRIHLEEDTGRLIHPIGADYSLVDFNRAGIPLMELVTEPDINSAKEARLFAQELQLILRYLGVSDADMEKGQLRVEANISLLPLKSKIQNFNFQTNSKLQIQDLKLGTKVEIKNLNSFKAVEKAIEYEIKRQQNFLELGKKIIQETRGWSEIKGATVPQREKEEAHDYRYFPEPDLPPLHITHKEILEIRSKIPELPQARRKRFADEYFLGKKDIEVFVQNKDLGEYFEKVVSELRNWVKEVELKAELSEKENQKLVQLAANYIITDLQSFLKKSSITNEDFLITPENFAEFITLIYKEKISSKIAKIVLEEMFKTGADPSQIIEKKRLEQIIDESEIEKIIKNILTENKKAVQDYKKGKTNALQFLIGQIMAKTNGKASPQLVNKLLKKNLTKI